MQRGWQGGVPFVYFEYGSIVLFKLVHVVVTYKRLHDFNASGWWVLAMAAEYGTLTLALVISPTEYVHLISVLVMSAGESADSLELYLFGLFASAVFFIVCGVIKGTDGANRFGEKPRYS